MNTGLLIAFLLVSPGFCLAYSVRAFSRYDIKIDSQNHTSHLILLIIFSACIQIILLPAYTNMILMYSDIDLWQAYSNIEKFLKVKEHVVSSEWIKRWIVLVGYIPFSYCVSLLIGFLFISVIEKGWWKTRFLHGAMYPIIEGKAAHPIFCSVLTKFQHDSCFVMYRGILQEISYVSKHKIEYLSLSIPHRYLFHIDVPQAEVSRTASVHAGTLGGTTPSAAHTIVPLLPAQRQNNRPNIITTPKTRVSYFNTDVSPELLTLQGENIENVLFSKYFPLGNPIDWKFWLVLALLPVAVCVIYPPIFYFIYEFAAPARNVIYSLMEKLCMSRY